MRPLFAFVVPLALLLGGGDGRAQEPSEFVLPWLRGFPTSAVSDEPTYRGQLRLAAWQAPDAACVTSATGAFELVADAATAPGVETILASYPAGIVVLDARGKKLAAAPAFGCRGSLDAIEYIAVGAPLPTEPTIAIAATAGGRAERTTWMFLFAVRGGGLAPLFAGSVEESRGGEVTEGEVTLRPGGMLEYRAPTGAVTLWGYDRTAGHYVLRELLRAPGTIVGPAA